MIVFNKNFKEIMTTILKLDRPFYFHDEGIMVEGGTVAKLKRLGFIIETGNTKEAFIEIGGGVYKKIIVKQWKVNKNYKHSRGATYLKMDLDLAIQVLQFYNEFMM